MIEETKIQRAIACILFICGISVGYLAFGESLLHQLWDILGFDVHPALATGRLNAVTGIIGIIVGGYGGTKASSQWINYKREKDCTLSQKEKRAPESKTRKE